MDAIERLKRISKNASTLMAYGTMTRSMQHYIWEIQQDADALISEKTPELQSAMDRPEWFDEAAEGRG